MVVSGRIIARAYGICAASSRQAAAGAQFRLGRTM
jgi:hypothetical protein